MSDYDCFAKLYDLEHRDFSEDIVFYRNFAQRCGSPVLDVGCGTGRVTLPLARAGIEVLGIDHSAAMIALAEAHAAEARLSKRVRFSMCDVRELDIETSFSLAIFALNGFLHLLTAADQLAALHNIYRALLPGGVLLVDVPNPHTIFSLDHDGQQVLRSRFQSPEGRAIWCFVNTQTDLAAQLQHLMMMYDEIVSEHAGESGLLHRTTIKTDVRFVYHYEMIGLLERTGFQVDAVYGSYELDPYQTDSQTMLFVAYKSK